MLDLLKGDVRHTEKIEWTNKRLHKVLVLRMVRKNERYYVTYCMGQMVDGYLCEVKLPFESLSKRTWKTELIDYARADKVFCKDLGVFASISLVKVPVDIDGNEEADTDTPNMEASSDE